MKTMKLSELKNYSGIDVSNEISLFEYGLLCDVTNLDDIHCFYGIGSNDGCNYDTFDCGNISNQEINDLLDELDKSGLLSYVGMPETDWKNSFVISKLHDLLSYFGYENIFGSCYNSFEIGND